MAGGGWLRLGVADVPDLVAPSVFGSVTLLSVTVAASDGVSRLVADSVDVAADWRRPPIRQLRSVR